MTADKSYDWVDKYWSTDGDACWNCRFCHQWTERRGESS